MQNHSEKIWVRDWKWGLIAKGHEGTFEGDGYVHYLDGDGFIGIYQTDQTAYIKYVQLILC